MVDHRAVTYTHRAAAIDEALPACLAVFTETLRVFGEEEFLRLSVAELLFQESYDGRPAPMPDERARHEAEAMAGIA